MCQWAINTSWQSFLERNWLIGGEPSGHIVCSETSTTGDGIVTALRVLSAMCQKQQPLAELRAKFKKYPQVLVNVRITKGDDPNQLPEIKHAIDQAQRKLGSKGRVLLRCSGTEPLVRVMVEGESVAQVKELAEQLALLVKNTLG